MWWVAGTVVALIVLRHLWRAYKHPAAALGRQAVNMGWVAAVGHTKDAEGFRDVRLSRDGVTATISFRGQNVKVESSRGTTVCRNFVEAEQWLVTVSTHPVPDGAPPDPFAQVLLGDDVPPLPDHLENTPEMRYYEEVEGFMRHMGRYEQVLESQGLDSEFGIATLETYKAGYVAGTSAKVIGALVMDAAHKHRGNRDFGIEFLRGVQRNLEKEVRPNASPTE